MNDTNEDAIAAHMARNRELLAQLAAMGHPELEEHAVEFHFWSPSAVDASALQDLLRPRGYQTTADRATDNDDDRTVVSVTARATMSLAAAGSEVLTRELTTLATATNSDFDGWGVSLQQSPARD